MRQDHNIKKVNQRGEVLFVKIIGDNFQRYYENEIELRNDKEIGLLLEDLKKFGLYLVRKKKSDWFE